MDPAIKPNLPQISFGEIDQMEIHLAWKSFNKAHKGLVEISDWVNFSKRRNAALDRIRVALAKYASPRVCFLHGKTGDVDPSTVLVSTIVCTVFCEKVINVSPQILSSPLCWECVKRVLSSRSPTNHLNRISLSTAGLSLPDQVEHFETIIETPPVPLKNLHHLKELTESSGGSSSLSKDWMSGGRGTPKDASPELDVEKLDLDPLDF